MNIRLMLMMWVPVLVGACSSGVREGDRGLPFDEKTEAVIYEVYGQADLLERRSDLYVLWWSGRHLRDTNRYHLNGVFVGIGLEGLEQVAAILEKAQQGATLRVVLYSMKDINGHSVSPHLLFGASERLKQRFEELINTNALRVEIGHLASVTAEQKEGRAKDVRP